MSGPIRLYACMIGSTVLIAGPAIAAEVSGSAASANPCCADGRSGCDFADALNGNPNASPDPDDSN